MQFSDDTYFKCLLVTKGYLYVKKLNAIRHTFDFASLRFFIHFILLRFFIHLISICFDSSLRGM